MACLMSATDSVRSRRPVESSWFERMGAGSRAGAVMAADAGGGAMEVGAPDEVTAGEAVDGPEDIAIEESDTKLVEPSDLPGRGRRLYGKEEVVWRRGARCRQRGAVARGQGGGG